MRILRVRFRALRLGLIGLGGAILLFLLAGTLGGIIPSRVDQPSGPIAQSIWLVPGPIHTDILIPVTPQVRALFASDDRLIGPQTGFLLVGWGARDFYTTTGTYRDLSARAVFRGIFGDRAVMRLAPVQYGYIPEGFSQIDLTAAQFDTVVKGIDDSFVQPFKALDHPGFSLSDRFYEGRGQFNLLRTCSVWVGDILRQADVPVGIWTPFTWSLLRNT